MQILLLEHVTASHSHIRASSEASERTRALVPCAT